MSCPVLSIIFVCFDARAQWTLPNASNNINNTNTGFVGIGTTTPGTLLDIGNATRNPGAPSASSIMGLSVRTSNATSNFMTDSMLYAEQTAPSTSNIEALVVCSVTSNPTGNVSLALPLVVEHIHAGSGTLGEARGVEALILQNGSGNITNAVSFFGGFGGRGTCTIQNGYGLYMPSFPANITNKYGVYITDETARNYFAGSLAIGTTTSGSNKLAVEGTIGARKVVVTATNPFPDYVFEPPVEYHFFPFAVKPDSTFTKKERRLLF